MDLEMRKKLYGAWAVSEYENAFRRMIEMINFNRISGDYAEFGCCSATTFRIAYRTFQSTYLNFGQERRHMWAFDLFAGLPTSLDPRDEHKMWRAGSYDMLLDKFVELCDNANIPRDAYTAVKGFYRDSLIESPEQPTIDLKNICLAYIDCDMYSSTKDVLAYLAPRLKHGMVICFDDYFCYNSKMISGEKLAFSRHYAAL